MKRILSSILVIAMMLTVSPVTFAATSDGILKTGTTVYNANVGDTVSIPVYATATDGSDLALGGGGQFDVAISSTDGVTIAFEGGLISSEDLRNVESATSKVRAFWESNVTATSTSPLFTVKYTITKAGTYTVSISDEDIESTSGASYTLDKVGATITVTEASVPVTETCPFRANSTKVAEEQFEYSNVATAGTDVKDAGITGLTIDRSGNGSELAYTKIVADPEDPSNLVLKDYHPQYAKDATTKVEDPNVTNHVYRQYDANCDSDYIVLSHKLYSPAGAYMRLYFDVEYKAYNNGQKDAAATAGQTNMGAVQAVIHFGDQKIIDEKGGGGTALITANDYVGKWSEWDYVMDTVKWTAELYVNHEYMLTFGLPRSYHRVDTTANYISGIDRIGFRFDRKSNKGTAYWDNFSISSMSAAQKDAAFASDTVTFTKETITTEEKLPVKSDVFGSDVTWTSSDANVTIGTDGSIALADGVDLAEDVKLTASYRDKTSEFTVDVVGTMKYAAYSVGETTDRSYAGIKLGAINNAYTYMTDTATNVNINNSIRHIGKTTRYFVYDKTENKTEYMKLVDKDTYEAATTAREEKSAYFEAFSTVSGDGHVNREHVGPTDGKRWALGGATVFRNIADLRKGRETTQEYIHFDATPAGFTQADNNITIEVTYLDIGKGYLVMQYKKLNDPNIQSVNVGKLEDTGVWKTAKVDLTDADFSNAVNTGLMDQKQDFRFYGSDPKSMYYVSEVKVYETGYKKYFDEPAISEYAQVSVTRHNVSMAADGTLSAQQKFTPAADGKATLYIAIYNEKGNLVGVSTSGEVDVTAGTAVTLSAPATTGDYKRGINTVKTFLWDADLKPIQ